LARTTPSARGTSSLGATIEALAEYETEVAPKLFALFAAGQSFGDVVATTGIHYEAVRVAHEEWKAGFTVSPKAVARLSTAERLREARHHDKVALRRDELEAKERRVAALRERTATLARVQSNKDSNDLLRATMAMFSPPSNSVTK
jgi:ubiquinone biosynthesis protein UbiJ